MEILLKEWYGILLFVLFDLLAVTVVICITYRPVFKRIFDFFTAIVLLTVLSPLYLVAYLVCLFKKKRGEIEEFLQREKFVGKKGKIVILHTFNCGKFGKILRVYDLFCGRISIIGTKAMTSGECAFLDEDEEERMAVRIGFIHPLVINGNENTDYDEMISVEKSYAKRYSFFGDIKIFFTWLLKKIRGEDDGYMGETAKTGYLEALLKDERISQADYEAGVSAE